MSKLIAGKIDLYDVIAFGWKLNLRDTFTWKLVNEHVRFNIMFEVSFLFYFVPWKPFAKVKQWYIF